MTRTPPANPANDEHAPAPQAKFPSSARQPTEMDKTVGKRLREARRTDGLSQQELAVQVGLTFQQIQKYESATNRISAGLLYRFSVVLDRPLTWFFDLPDAPHNA